MAEYAALEYTATGGQTDFNIAWEYLSEAHIELTINAATSTDFSIVSSGTVLRLDNPASNGDIIRISRDTPTDTRLVDFEDGAGLPEDDLDRAFDQIFFALEEFLFNTDIETIDDAVDAAADSAAAALASQTAAASSASTASTAATNAGNSATAAAASATAADASADSITGVFDLNFSGDAKKALVVNAGATAVENRRSVSGAVSGGVVIDTVFEDIYISTAESVTGAQNFTKAHNLGQVPYALDAYLVCQSTDGNFAAGSVLKASGLSPLRDNNNLSSLTLYANGTNVLCNVVNDADPFAVSDSADTRLALDESKWFIYFVARAWKA